MDRHQRSVCKNCFDPDDCELKEKLMKLIVLYNEKSSHSDGPLPEEVDTGGTRTLGLCTSCTHRDTCLDQMVEGGVWHCADYA